MRYFLATPLLICYLVFVDKCYAQANVESQRTEFTLPISLMEKMEKVLPPEWKTQLNQAGVKYYVDSSLSLSGFFSESENSVLTNPLIKGTSLFNRTLAHETFHALQFHIHPHEALWIQEGLAEVFETFVVGSMNTNYLQNGLSDLQSDLLDSEKYEGDEPSLRGHQALFFLYLMTKTNNAQLFWTLATSKNNVFGLDTIKLAAPASADSRNWLQNMFEQFEISRIHGHMDSSVDPSIDYTLGKISAGIDPGRYAEDLDTKQIIKRLIKPGSIAFAKDIVKPQLASQIKNKIHIFYLERYYPYQVIDADLLKGDTTRINSQPFDTLIVRSLFQ